MRHLLGIATLLAFSAVAAGARAQTVTFPSNAHMYDTGSKPAIALATNFDPDRDNPWEVQVHEGGNGDLWYSSGDGGATGGVTGSGLGGSHWYTNGYRPTLTAYDYDSDATVLEVHQANNGAGPLWHMFGNVTNYVHDNAVQWGTAVQYDYGMHPAVASVWGTGVTVEVHQAGPGVGALWSHVLSPTWSTNGFAVGWAPSAVNYTRGENPSVAVTSGGYVDIVEVHQATDGFGPLWYMTGKFSADRGAIVWNGAHSYDQGENPTVVIRGNSVLEVHQGNAGSGTLWYHTGLVQADGTIAWSPNAYHYDNGYVPTLAIDPTNYTRGTDGHQAGTGVGPLWSHPLTFQ
jgi:hypothetical protein